MKIQWIAVLIAIFLSYGSDIVFAAPFDETQKLQASDEMLQGLADNEQARRLEELARSITNLERRMDRLDDRFEKLDHDLKELKRKV